MFVLFFLFLREEKLRKRKKREEYPKDEGELLREGNWRCEGTTDEGLRRLYENEKLVFDQSQKLFYCVFGVSVEHERIWFVE